MTTPNVVEPNPNIMVYVDGSGTSFHCDCGCNVFRAGPKPLTYICNSCSVEYTGEAE